MNEGKLWIGRWTAITSAIAWVFSNALDVFSVLVLVQTGAQPVLVRYHPAEFFIIYAGMRLLVTLACCLLVLFVDRRWPWMSRMVWSALTVCALITAVVAWWRLYR